jgi:hypothetical protein
MKINIQLICIFLSLLAMACNSNPEMNNLPSEREQIEEEKPAREHIPEVANTYHFDVELQVGDAKIINLIDTVLEHV